MSFTTFVFVDAMAHIIVRHAASLAGVEGALYDGMENQENRPPNNRRNQQHQLLHQQKQQQQQQQQQGECVVINKPTERVLSVSKMKMKSSSRNTRSLALPTSKSASAISGKRHAYKQFGGGREGKGRRERKIDLFVCQ
jgi:exopolyphosphatase/pppGpp-phosphohydrolase